MPDTELNHADKWAAQPEPGATLQGPGVTAHVAACTDRTLVSGDLAAFARVSGIDAADQKQGARALRLARDRLLVVGALPGLAPGWHTEGFALSDISAGLAMVELAGPGLAVLIAMATTTRSDDPGPSASITFAGVPAVLDHADEILRLHVERGLLAYLWSWLAAAFRDLAG